VDRVLFASDEGDALNEEDEPSMFVDKVVFDISTEGSTAVVVRDVPDAIVSGLVVIAEPAPEDAEPFMLAIIELVEAVERDAVLLRREVLMS
jgi:hypothetical protein